MKKSYIYLLYRCLTIVIISFNNIFASNTKFISDNNIVVSDTSNNSSYKISIKEEHNRRIKCKTFCYLYIKNNLQIKNDLCINRNALIGRTLTVGSSSLFNGPVTINFPTQGISQANALTVNGSTNFNGNVIVRGDLIVQGDIIGTLDNVVIPDGSITTTKLADGSVTEPKLANNAVSTRTVQPNSITNDKLASASTNNTPNTVVLRDSTGSFAAQNIEFQSNSSTLNVVGSNLAGYKLLGGYVNADGTIATGTEDFTVENIGVGRYLITFTPVLATQPIVTAIAQDNFLSPTTIQNPTTTQVEIDTYDIPPGFPPSPANKPFGFIVFARPS